jgi:heme exporter protein D
MEIVWSAAAVTLVVLAILTLYLRRRASIGPGGPR